MVVFKSLLVFLLVFCIRGIYCKAAYDEQAVAPGIWSRLWGWVTYLNPWGSAVNTSATLSMPKHDVNATQIKNSPFVEARQFTATTILGTGNSTALVKFSSDESVENEETTTPIILVQNVQISTTTEQHSLEVKASTTVITSGQNNTSLLEKSATDSREPKTLTTPVDSVQYKHHTEPNLSTVSTVSLTAEEPAMDEPEEPKASTTPIVLDLINPITAGELVTEEPLELEVLPMDQNKPLKSEVTNISFIPGTDNQTIVKEPLESVTSIYVSTFDTPTVSEFPSLATDYPSEPEASTTTIDIDQNILTSREEPVTEQTLESEVTTISIVPDTDTPTTAVELLELETSTYVSALDTPTETKESVTKHLSQPKLSTTPIAMDLDFPTSTNEPAMEQLFGFESLTTASALNNPTTAADDSLVPETTTRDQRDHNNTTIATDKIQSIRYDDQKSIKRSEAMSGKYEATERSEGSILTELVTNPYPDVAVAVSERQEEPTYRGEAWIMSDSVTGQYSGVATAVTVREEESMDKSKTLIFSETAVESNVAITLPGKDDESIERTETSTLTETATGQYPKVFVPVLGRDGESTERSEVSATDSYSGVDVAVSGKDEVSTEESKASILAETDNPYKELQEVSVSTVTNPNQFLEVEKALSTRVIEVSTNVNAAFTAVYEVQAMFSEQDELAATRVSRSHSAGYRLSFDPLMFLFYAVYFLKA